MTFACLGCYCIDFIRMEEIDVDDRSGRMTQGRVESRFKCANCGRVYRVGDDGEIVGTTHPKATRSAL